ncbi:MAG: FtsQ-type POTRA domain-containing protein [Sphaerochaetaceae bacterium]|jgi:hypothetical protein
MSSRRQLRSGIPASVKILLLLALVFILLAWYSLRFIPQFDIQQVDIKVTGGTGQVPLGANRIAGPLKGLSQFELRRSELEKRFEQLAVVQSAKVTRKLPDTLTVDIVLVAPQALVAAVDDSGSLLATYLVKHERLIELPAEDRSVYGDTVSTVEVPQEYATLLKRYGLDEGIKTVLSLVADLREADETRNTLITKIKYDNNSSNNFGRMVLELPRHNARLWVREPVSAQLVVKSIALIEQSAENEPLRFLDQEPKRFDLYADALVKR